MSSSVFVCFDSICMEQVDGKNTEECMEQLCNELQRREKKARDLD
jgi:hypothetical protein